MMDMESLRTTAVINAAIGQTIFVLLYATSPWWKTFLGHSLFFKSLSLGMLFNAAVASRLYDWGWEDETFVVIYFAVGAGIWLQLAAFLRVRLQHRERLIAGVPHEQ